eukprot:8376-Heterococcus_DN1.PRE.5
MTVVQHVVASTYTSEYSLQYLLLIAQLQYTRPHNYDIASGNCDSGWCKPQYYSPTSHITQLQHNSSHDHEVTSDNRKV